MVRYGRLIRPLFIWSVVVAAGAVSAYLPAALGIDAMSGGSALTFVECLVALAGVVFGIAAGLRSRALQ